MNNNYLRLPTGGVVFFDDRRPFQVVPPPGAVVFRRPPGKLWENIPQIIGEYSNTEPDDVLD